MDSATKCKDCSGVSAVDAHVRGTGEGGEDSASHRLYQVSAVAAGSREGRRGSAHGEEISYEQYAASTIARPQTTARELSQRHLRHPFVAAHDGPQAHCPAVACLSHILFFHRRTLCHDDPHPLAHADRVSGHT